MHNLHNTLVSNPFTTTFIKAKAWQLSRRSDFSLSDIEDLHQQMKAYLLHKADLFDPARGTIEAFTTTCINSWIAMYLRGEKRLKRGGGRKTVSLERTLVECDGDLTALGNTLLEEDGDRLSQTHRASVNELFELKEAVGHAMECLDPQDRKILNSVVAIGVNKTAKTLGLAKQRICGIKHRARKVFEKAGISQATGTGGYATA